MLTLYVFNNETNRVVAKVLGDTNQACEEWADQNYSTDDYSWTYSPAFGFNDGLVDSSDAEEVVLN